MTLFLIGAICFAFAMGWSFRTWQVAQAQRHAEARSKAENERLFGMQIRQPLEDEEHATADAPPRGDWA